MEGSTAECFADAPVPLQAEPKGLALTTRELCDFDRKWHRYGEEISLVQLWIKILFTKGCSRTSYSADIGKIA